MNRYNPDVLADVISYISELSLDGIDSLQSHMLNKDSALTDEELAMAIFAEEAQGMLNVAKERASHATGQATTIFEELEEMEAAARYDHLVAIAIAEGRDIPSPPVYRRFFRTSLPELDSGDEASSASSSSVSDTDDEGDATDEQSEDGTDDASLPRLASRPPTAGPSVKYEQCTICGDDIHGSVYKAPCGDVFDKDCLETMFRKATVDESLFPPRCCLANIPIADVQMHLSPDLVSLYNKKTREFTTTSRVYCHEPRCSAFIGATTDAPATLRCPDCQASTCGYCKTASHTGKKCSDTDDLNSMAEVMKKNNGWQRCPDCRHVVELSIGCYHIICVCKAQFCYLCGARWKECPCPQFAVPPDIE